VKGEYVHPSFKNSSNHFYFMFEPKYSLQEAKVKLEALCAYQERCQFEIDQKLYEWNFQPEQRNQLIADLISNNFINEQRFAEAYVSGKFNIKKWGRNKIKNQLKLKQISAYSIKMGMKEIDPEKYWSTIISLTKKKKTEVEQKKGDQWERKAKIFRFLLSKGYESDLISDAVKEVFNELTT
jgi:regulatory protein